MTDAGPSSLSANNGLSSCEILPRKDLVVVYDQRRALKDHVTLGDALSGRALVIVNNNNVNLFSACVGHIRNKFGNELLSNDLGLSMSFSASSPSASKD